MYHIRQAYREFEEGEKGMNIVVRQTSIALSGKAWEIRAKLKQMGKQYDTVKEWCDSVHQHTTRVTASATAKKKAVSSEKALPIVLISDRDRRSAASTRSSLD